MEVQYAFLAYFTGIYFYLYNYMRIMTAVAFIFLCYASLLEERKRRSLIFAGIAILFHRSAAVVFLMVLVILFFKEHKKVVICLGLGGMAAIIARPYFFLSLIKIERYNALITATDSAGGFIGIGTTVKILPFFVILYIYRKYKKELAYTAALYLSLANLGFSFLGYYVDSASRLPNMYFVFHYDGNCY